MAGSKIKILIVEDEFIFALDTKNTLLSLGYDVIGITSNFNDTIDCVKQKKPDLVLMDIIIKGDLDGIETAKYIQENFNINSLFLTAYSDSQTKKKVMALNPIGLMFKPLNDKQFREIMLSFKKEKT